MFENFEETPAHKKSDKGLTYLRLILLAAGVAYLIFGWAYQAYLPGSLPMSMTQRIGASLFFFSILAFTYLSSWAKENPEILMYLGAAGAVSHLLYFAFVNNYQLNYALSVIVVIIVINFLLPGDRKLRLFNAAVNGGVAFSVLFGADPTFNRVVYVVSFVSISIISYLLSSSKRQAREEYERLFRDSPIGLLRATPDGTIQYYNEEMSRMFGDLSQEELEKIDIFEVLGVSSEEPDVIEDEEKLVTCPWGEKIWVDYSVKRISSNSDESSDVIIACNDISERKEAEDRIEYMTFHDDLTELHNRTFYKQVVDELNTASQFPFSVLFIDVDKLKLVNDAFGHNIGDELLIKASEVIEDSCREEDLVFRWGGDEIVVLLPNTRAEEREKVRGRIHDRRRETEFGPIDLRFSVGGATAERHLSKKGLDYLFQEAEEEMYERKLGKQEEVSREVLDTIMDRIGDKSDYVLAHLRRVKKLALKLGEELGMNEGELDKLGKAARYHDIGKVAEDQRTLAKYYQDLTEEEEEELKTHCNVGYQIAKELKGLSGVARSILHHHEWWDGSGYPKGASEEEIPYMAKVISVVNVYDAMTAPQCHLEKKLSRDEAVERIKRRSGSQFDPEIVDKFLEMAQPEFSLEE